MSSTQALIRKGKPEDIYRIFEFETQYIREMEAENMKKWEEAEAGTLRSIKETLDTTLILELDGIRAGHGRWVNDNEGACITSLFIRPCMRGKKWGGRLLEALEDDIKKSGSRRVTLSTLKHNPARHLYEKHKYVRTGVEKGWIHYEKELQ